jgi:1-acyl-sn-glycerol-3-phosphate acyltransferase
MIRLLPSIVFNIVMFGGGLVLSLYGLLLLRVAPGGLPGLGRFWAGMCLRALRLCCGVRLAVGGAPPPAGGVIIAAQHQSELDILVLLALLRRPAFVMKQELRRIPLFGALLAPAGMIAVDRAGGAAALRAMVADCRAAIAAGQPIVIFPEGTRMAPGVRGALRPGIVALARALNVPVVPVSTDSGRCWGRKSFLKTPGTVHVNFHEALPATARREDILVALAEYFYGPA